MNRLQTHTVTQAARLLNLGPKKLFQALRDRRILNRDNLPYRQYVDAGYFRVRMGTCHTPIGDRAYGQPLVTVKGLQFLERQFADQIQRETATPVRGGDLPAAEPHGQA